VYPTALALFGREMQADPVKHTLKAPGPKYLKLEYETAFNFCFQIQLAPLQFGPGTSQFFAVCFWLVLIMLGLDSVFADIEATITMVCDRSPWWGNRLFGSIKTRVESAPGFRVLA